MSLINYVEPMNPGLILMGLGSLIISLVVAWILYRFYLKLMQLFDVSINRATKFELLEGSFLDKIGKTKGIDLERELIKRQMLKDVSKKSFRRKIEEQIYEDMFGKDKKE